MKQKFKELKKDILTFFDTIKNEDVKEWTPENFSKINAMITKIEEEFNNMEEECKSVITDIHELREILSDIKKQWLKEK